MKTLSHNDLVKLPSWDAMTAAYIGTLAGSALEGNEDNPQKAIERLTMFRARNEPEAWAGYTGSILSDSKAYYEARRAEVAGATIIEDGETVEIEGVQYTVKVMKGCTNRPIYSDPIKFIRAGV